MKLPFSGIPDTTGTQLLFFVDLSHLNVNSGQLLEFQMQSHLTLSISQDECEHVE